MIPVNPATIKANGILVDNFLREYFQKYFPAYGYHITSGYRTKEHNTEIGGAEDSAHMYNLARDFVLLDQTGAMVTEDKAKKLYDEFFTDWIGFSYFSPSGPDSTYHIHANVPREWSKKTFWIGTLVAVIGGIVLFSKLTSNPKFKKLFSRVKGGM